MSVSPPSFLTHRFLVAFLSTDNRRSRQQGPTKEVSDADREPADMVTRKGQPGAQIPAVEGLTGKKAGRAAGAGAAGEPAEGLSKFRQDPESELHDSGVPNPSPASVRPIRLRFIKFHRPRPRTGSRILYINDDVFSLTASVRKYARDR